MGLDGAGFSWKGSGAGRGGFNGKRRRSVNLVEWRNESFVMGIFEILMHTDFMAIYVCFLEKLFEKTCKFVKFVRGHQLSYFFMLSCNL